MIKKSIITIVGVIIVGFGVSMSLKGAIGVGAWDAFGQTISLMTGIKVGYLSIMLNISCVVAQILILRKEFKIIQILQIGLAIVLGVVINFFFYTVLSSVVINQYYISFIFAVVGIVICAFGVSMVMAINLCPLPLEGLCNAISKKINYPFGKIRQLVDVISIVVILLMAVIFKLELMVREGTVIGMLIFGPLLTIFMKKITPYLDKTVKDNA